MVDIFSNKKISKFLFYFILVVIFCGVLFPIYWMGITSLKTDLELYSQETSKLIVLDLSTESYIELIKEEKFLMYYLNSLVVVGGAIAISLVISLLASYSLGRIQPPGHSIIIGTLWFSYLLPICLLMLPMFFLLQQLRLVNSSFGLTLTYVSYLVPFATWLLVGYIQTIPTELEDAAKIDGCGHLGIMFKILVPLMLPGIITVLIFGFTMGWNIFLYPFVFISTNSKQLLPVAIQNLQRGDVYPWQKLMGAGIMTSIPPMLFMIFVHRYMIRGLTAGAIK